MPVVWGHVESIVNRRNNPPSPVVSMCEPLGTCRVESIAGENTTITIGFERLRLEEIRPAKFVVATVREHAGWLEPEWIDGIFFNTHSAIELREESMPTNSAGRG
jgi:hypothetical protein